MQILAISDTHGSFHLLEKAILLHPDADLIVHCGDGEADADLFLSAHPEFAPRFYYVRGNCDPSNRSPLLLTLDLPYGHKLAAVHGHHYTVGDVRENLSRMGESQGADLVLFGHFHTRIDTTLNGVKLFSPGAVSNPHDGKGPSYGLIDVYKMGFLTSHAELPPPHYSMP